MKEKKQDNLGLEDERLAKLADLFRRIIKEKRRKRKQEKWKR